MADFVANVMRIVGGASETASALANRLEWVNHVTGGKGQIGYCPFEK